MPIDSTTVLQSLNLGFIIICLIDNFCKRGVQGRPSAILGHSGGFWAPLDPSLWPPLHVTYGVLLGRLLAHYKCFQKPKTVWNFIVICRLYVPFHISFFTYSTMHRCCVTYMYENINTEIYPGVWLIKQPSKLIWKAYSYCRWTAKFHSLTVCGLEYWFEVVFWLQVIFAQNFAWKVLTQ